MTPDQRVYYRHHRTGDLGWMVVRGGNTYIRLDRGNQEILKPFRPDDWIAEKEPRAMSPAQMGAVAFEAHCALAFARGDHGEAKKEWLDLSDEERLLWIERGPQNGIYKRLYDAIMGVLKA